MATFVLLLGLSQLPPGPLDAFRANFASIKAEMDFEVTEGSFKGNAKRLWEGQVPDYAERHAPDADLTIVGHWACDGTAEYYRFGSPDEVLDRASKDQVKREAGKVFYKVLFIPKTEALWDGELLIGHQNHPHFRHRKDNPHWRIVSVETIDSNAAQASYLGTGRGPLHWGTIFPHVLKSYGGAASKRHPVMRWGNLTEVETYRREEPDGTGWQQIEISYDPAIGYLPRFVRTLSYFAPNDRTYSDEMYLIEARPCAAGGFVPTEWYNISFDVPNFKSRFPNYDDSTDLAPPMAELPGGSHFRASSFRDFSGPVALTEIKDVHSIAAVGGMVARPAKIPSLSLGDVKKLLGKRVSTPARRVMLNIDTAELRELEHPSSSRWWPYLVGVSLAIISAAILVRWRRVRARIGVLVFAVLCGTSGCGYVGDPVVKLTASYKDTFVYINPRTHELPMTLVVLNSGNQAIRLSGADGGCSCRKVDQSTLPAVVRPGRIITIPVRLSITPTTAPQMSQFQIDTDKGIIGVSAPFYTLVSHELNPETIANNYMYEADEWAFDLSHRVVLPSSGGEPVFRLIFPKEFVAVQGATREGRVGGAPGYAYRETTYRLTLKDRSLGAHKASISVSDPEKDTLLEAPIVWKRVPFLSSVPDRVILGTRPVRVFLRCPDEDVELTKIVSAPEGIKAVVSSTREVTVMPGENAPRVLDGVIEVGTTAGGRPPLRIPVVRYHSPSARPLAVRVDANRYAKGPP